MERKIMNVEDTNLEILEEELEEISEDSNKKLKKDEFIEQEWKRIGFHRALGGFWYNFVLLMFASLIGFLITLWIFPNYIMTFPTALGYHDIVKSLFAFYFMLMDAGISRAVQRFIADQNIKNPLKSIQYLQFFIWFQMITGVIQMTIIAVWVLQSVQTTEMAYAMWFFLMYSTIQFPGMLGIFTGALKAFQRYDKAGKISFIQTVVLEMTTRILCILIGRWYGRTHPEMGELMGATIGSIVGAYIDDFMAAAIAAAWTKPILQEINPEWKIKDMFAIDFDMKLVKECTWFGIRAIIPSLFHTLNQLIQISLLLRYLPNYATIWGLYTIAEGMAGIIGIFRFEITSPVSEAYNNGKEILAQNYLIRANKWGCMGIGWIMPMILAIIPLIAIIAGENYAAAAPMIGILMFGSIANQMGGTNANIFLGCNHPEYYFIQNLTEFLARLFVLYICLVYFDMGWLAIALGRISGWWGRLLIGIFIMNRYLFKFRINWWQSIIAPSIAGIVIYIICKLLVNFMFFPLTDLIGLIPSVIVIFVIGIFLLPFGVFFPIYAYLGGWDEEGLKVFKDAVEISGPSKSITKMVYGISYKISQKSPLFNKFPIDAKKATEEMYELMELRRMRIEQH